MLTAEAGLCILTLYSCYSFFTDGLEQRQGCYPQISVHAQRSALLSVLLAERDRTQTNKKTKQNKTKTKTKKAR